MHKYRSTKKEGEAVDDLSEKLDSLLSSPDSMQRIGELMAALTADNEPSPPPDPVPADSGLPDLSQLLKLLPLLGTLSKEDDNAALLKALRPHLSGERQKKLDEAGQWLKIARLLPLIKELKGEEHP